MKVQEEDRIERLEGLVGALAERVESLERRMAPAAPRPVAPPRTAPSPSPAYRAPAPRPPSAPDSQALPPPAARARPPRFTLRLEDLFGGRVLAWLGGVAVLVGLALFFALAVSSGWIGEAERVLLAGAGAAALLALGVWLRERRAQTEAALAASGTGIAGLFMSITVAAEVYDLVPALPAFGLAAVVGATAMVLAVRWRSQLVAALGIVGSLLTPIAVEAPVSGTTVALLLTVTAAAAAVLVWQRWDWLGFATFAIATPQWVEWLFETGSVAGILVVLCAFGGAGVLAAVGFELRLPAARLRASSSLFFALNAIVLAAAGYLALAEAAAEPVGQVWLAAIAAAYLGIGLAGARFERMSHDLRLLVLTLGVLLANVAFAAIASGPVLAIGWAGSSVLFAAIAHVRRHRPADEMLAQLGLGGHLALAIAHALFQDASPALLGDSVHLPALYVAAAIAASCFASARIASTNPELRAVLDSAGLAAVAYLTALAADGPALAIALSVQAAALARIAGTRRDTVSLAGAVGFLLLAAGHVLAFEAPVAEIVRGDSVGVIAALALAAASAAAVTAARWVGAWRAEVRDALDAAGATAAAYLAAATLDGVLVAAAWGAAGVALALAAGHLRSSRLVLAAGGYASLALTHALMYEAAPAAFLYGAPDLAAACLALAAGAAAPLLLARLAWLDRPSRVVVAATGGLAVLYLASVAIVTGLQAGGEQAVLDLDVRQQGQAAVSTLWGLAGVGLLVSGLRREVAELRVAGLLLLLAAAAKVFMFDLAALTSIYRVVSFVALGLILLAGSFAYQRLRPRHSPTPRGH